MLTLSRSRASVAIAVGRRRRFAALIGLGLAPMLSGCITSERWELGIEIPKAYRASRGAPHGALPSLDWWRGFRSSELTALIEEAHAANFDIAAAVARIQQADA